MKKVAIIISPNWRDYAQKYLADCIKSVRAQNLTIQTKIFMADNESSEASFLFLKKLIPEAEIIRNKNNDGFAKGNNDCIKRALKQGFDYIALFNMDTVLDKDCLAELIKIAEMDKVGAVQARLMLADKTDRVNSLGNATHFLGFGYCLGYQDKYSDDDRVANIMYPSGAAVLFQADVLKKVGLFDEEFWMYNEDQDLGWRIWLAGWKCVLAPRAVVYHKYDFSRSITKYYWMDRNRILACLKSYHLLTIVLILPAWLAMELGLVLFSLKNGWFLSKLKVWKYFWQKSTWKYVLRERKKVQSTRQVSDRRISKLITGRIWYQEIGDWKLKIVNPFFNIYWQVVRRIIIW